MENVQMKCRRVNIIFRRPRFHDRWLPGDRYLIAALTRLWRGKKVSGIEKVFLNLCKGFSMLKVGYRINPRFDSITPGEPVIVLGIGKLALKGYRLSNPIVAGIGLMTHPAYWPDLCTMYPVARYLQHSEWAKSIYVPYYGDHTCDLWPAGIETSKWRPAEFQEKEIDLLVYNKIMWDRTATEQRLKAPIIEKIRSLGLAYKEVRYGEYKESQYMDLLRKSRAMIFLCEHESQGFACCEAMSMNVPIFAWDQGKWLDPERFQWNDPVVDATSVPFFDDRCGMKFKDLKDFNGKIKHFLAGLEAGCFEPRTYVLERLSLEKSATRMVEIIKQVYPSYEF